MEQECVNYREVGVETQSSSVDGKGVPESKSAWRNGCCSRMPTAPRSASAHWIVVEVPVGMMVRIVRNLTRFKVGLVFELEALEGCDLVTLAVKRYMKKYRGRKKRRWGIPLALGYHHIAKMSRVGCNEERRRGCP